MRKAFFSFLQFKVEKNFISCADEKHLGGKLIHLGGTSKDSLTKRQSLNFIEEKTRA